MEQITLPDQARQSQHLFIRYQQWARATALTLYRCFKVAGCDPEDYVQYATLGLLEAIQSYDPDMGTPFKAFARARVRGRILTEIVRFNEKAQYHSWQRNRAHERLDGLYEQSQDDDDDLTQCILDLALGLVLEVRDEVLDLPVGIQDTCYHSHEIAMLHQRAVSAIDALCETQAEVLKCHYLCGMSFVETASWLDVSKSYITHLHRNALHSLRKKLGW